MMEMESVDSIYERPSRVLACGSKTFYLGARTFVMGILNVTPDSFSDGGRFLGLDSAVSRAEQLIRDGADIIDIGGESTRPYSQMVSPEEELERILPLVKALVKRGIRNISIDTRNASTAMVCLDEGASWINDVSGLSHDRDMITAVRNADVLVLMHARGTPDVMQTGDIKYQNVVDEVRDFLRERVLYASENGIDTRRILVDPGIGFGKKLVHNLDLIRRLHAFQDIGIGVLCGPSRKAFIGELTGIKEPSERDIPTLGAVACSVLAGTDMVRVHNVKATVEALKVIDALAR